MFPEDKTGHIPRVCEGTFAQLCQFGVGVGVGSDKYINHKADAKAAAGEKKMSYRTEKVIAARGRVSGGCHNRVLGGCHSSPAHVS